jgi:hypothetical protein
VLLIVLAHVFVRDLFSKFDYHFSPNKLENLINSERSFGSFKPLKADDLVDGISIFHHFDLKS